MRARHKGRMNPHRHPGRSRVRHAEQLDHVSKLASESEVAGVESVDAFSVDPVRANPDAKSQTGQDHGLGGGVGPADVGGRIGLGIPQGLGGLEGIVEGSPVLIHRGEDVVGGAVDDARAPG